MTFLQFLKEHSLEMPVKEQDIELLYSQGNNAFRKAFGNNLKKIFEGKLKTGIGFPAHCNCPGKLLKAIKRLESVQPKKKKKDESI